MTVLTPRLMLLGLGLLLAAACAPARSAITPAAASSRAYTPTPLNPPVTVSVTDDHVSSIVGIYLGYDRDYFTQEGLNVALQFLRTQPEAGQRFVNAFLRGARDYYTAMQGQNDRSTPPSKTRTCTRRLVYRATIQTAPPTRFPAGRRFRTSTSSAVSSSTAWI
jgi:hypothetical protein